MTEEQKRMLIQLRMRRAATKTMLDNLKDNMSEAVQNELLDTLLKLNEEIERLENSDK